MISRVFVRSVLAAVVAIMVWLLNLTWSYQFRVIGQPIILTIIEGAVLLAALSLLIESFMSFRTATVNKSSPWFILSGLVFLSYPERENLKEDAIYTIHARTCEMFWVRSFSMALFSLLSAAFITIIYEMVVKLVLFLLNPHTPVVDWGQASLVIRMIVITGTVGGLLFWGFTQLEERLTGGNLLVKCAVLTMYGCIGLGGGLGAGLHFFDPLVGMEPLYISILMGTAVAMGIVSFFGAIFGLGFGLYKLIGAAVVRYSVLGNVWNTLCPVQKINIVE